MKKLLVTVCAVFLLAQFSMSQTDTATAADTVFVPLEGRGVTPAGLEGKWLLKSGIKMKKKSEVKFEKKPASGTVLSRDTVMNSKTINGKNVTTRDIEVVKVADHGNQITPAQTKNLHYPERPAINFYGMNETFTGFTGCNKFSGRYKIEGSRIKLKTAASTKMQCIGQYDELEFLAVLKKVNAYRIQNSRLELLKGNKTLLIFSRK